MKRIILVVASLLFSGAVFAQASSGTITTGTNSNAEQAVNINNQIGSFGGSGSSEVGYHGSYTVKSAPTVYAPALTASITETCWGSISGAVSVVGVGVTGAMTIKDYDCNRRLTAAIAGRMGRMDVAFNVMCQDDQFKAAAALTDKPCPVNTPVAKQGTEIVPQAKNSQDAAAHGNLAQQQPVATMTPNVQQDLKTGQLQYHVAEVPVAK